jgi:hypothetical protein
MAHATSRRSHTAEVRVRFHANPSELFGGKVELGQVSVRVLRFSVSVIP